MLVELKALAAAQHSKGFTRRFQLFRSVIMKRVMTFILCCLGMNAYADDPKLPDGYSLIISEDFDNPVSLENFAFSDPKAWRWSSQGKSSGALDCINRASMKPSIARHSNIALWSKKRCGDFIMEVDMKQSGKEYGHRDMCFVL